MSRLLLPHLWQGRRHNQAASFPAEPLYRSSPPLRPMILRQRRRRRSQGPRRMPSPRGSARPRQKLRHIDRARILPPMQCYPRGQTSARRSAFRWPLQNSFPSASARPRYAGPGVPTFRRSQQATWRTPPAFGKSSGRIGRKCPEGQLPSVTLAASCTDNCHALRRHDDDA
ncbi:hypothetical protein D3C80_1070580 [compost metagenome]